MNHPIYCLELKKNNIDDTMSGSWIAVAPCYDENQQEYWRILGCSEETLTDEFLSDIDILAIVYTSYSSAEYRDSHGDSSTGKSQYAFINYYNAHTGDFYGDETLSAGALPEKAVSTPDYKVSGTQICQQITSRLESRIDPDYNIDTFVIENTTLVGINDDYFRIYTIPNFITDISEEGAKALEECKSMVALELPDNIRDTNLPDRKSNVMLGVRAGKSSEQLAINHGFVYYDLDTRMGYLPEGVTSYNNGRYEYGPYDYLTIPSSVTYINDSIFSTNYEPFVVEADSYAWQFALDTQHVYCFAGHTEELFVPKGRNYFFLTMNVLENTTLIHIPDTVDHMDDQMTGYLEDSASHLTFAGPEGAYMEHFASLHGITYLYE